MKYEICVELYMFCPPGNSSSASFALQLCLEQSDLQ